MPATPSTARVVHWVEQGLVPDRVVRLGIRRLLNERLQDIRADDAQASAALAADFVASMRTAPLALLPQKANEQHYEVPAEFFSAVLGTHRKYSCCWWGDPAIGSLDAAEAAALDLTCRRAGLADGQQVLELGCGWGSLSLWMAERFPASRIVAVSNSHSQRACIEAEAAHRGLANLRVITQDMNDFDPQAHGLAGGFDRVVSVEMFEHLRNWPEAFRRVAGWLRPGGRFFMHVFAHRSTPYAFEVRDAGDWMSEHFFSGGMMPSDDLPLHFQDHLRLVDRWRWDGTHYQRTAEAWLARMDAQRPLLSPVFDECYGRDQAGLWWMRWRLFFMSVAELFGHDAGQQWWVGHYLFERRA